MYSLNITDIAEEDILNTAKYIADVLEAPMAAHSLLNEIERHEEILENNPNIYPVVPDEYLAEKGIRYTMVKNYLMFYIINEHDKTVTVIRFLYGRRDWKNILKSNHTA